MADDREDRIRDRAYRLWQQDGEPDGRDREHWEQARRELTDDSVNIDRDAGAAAPAIGDDRADTPLMPDEPVADMSPPTPDAPAAPAPAPAPAAPGALKSAAKKPPARRKRPG